MLRESIIRVVNHRHFVLWCLVLSAVLRLLWISIVRVDQIYDWQWYYGRAASVAAGQGFQERGIPTAYWPAGYPLFLSAVFRLVGSHVLVGKLLNIGEWLGASFCTYKFVQKVFGLELAARLALFLMSFHPNSIAWTSFLTADMFLGFLIILGSALFVYAEGRWTYLALDGLVWGLAVLTKPQCFAIPAILILVFLREKKKSMFATALVLYLLMAASVVPWMMRNKRVLGKPVLADNGGIVLLIGNNPNATGRNFWDERVYPFLGDLGVDEKHLHDDKEVARDARARQVAINYIEHHPVRVVELWPKKFIALYLSDVEAFYYALDVASDFAQRDRPVYLGLRIVGELYYIGVIVLFFASLPFVFRSARLDYFIGILIVLYFTAIYLVFMGDPRYHLSLMPFIAMYAGIGAGCLLGEYGASQPLPHS